MINAAVSSAVVQLVPAYRLVAMLFSGLATTLYYSYAQEHLPSRLLPLEPSPVFATLGAESNFFIASAFCLEKGD